MFGRALSFGSLLITSAISLVACAPEAKTQTGLLENGAIIQTESTTDDQTAALGLVAGLAVITREDPGAVARVRSDAGVLAKKFGGVSKTDPVAFFASDKAKRMTPLGRDASADQDAAIVLHRCWGASRKMNDDESALFALNATSVLFASGAIYESTIPRRFVNPDVDQAYNDADGAERALSDLEYCRSRM